MNKRIDLSILIKIQSDWHAPLFQTTIHLLHELARGLRKVCKHLRLPELRMQYIWYITSMISRLYVLYVLYFIASFVLIHCLSSNLFLCSHRLERGIRLIVSALCTAITPLSVCLHLSKLPLPSTGQPRRWNSCAPGGAKILSRIHLQSGNQSK